MKKNITILLAAFCSTIFAIPAFGDVGEVSKKDKNKECHTVVVCKPRHKKPKAPPVEPPVVKTEEPVAPPVELQPRTIVIEKKVVEQVPVPVVVKEKCKDNECKPQPKVVVGAHLGIGAGVLPPNASGNFGLRLEIPKAYLGFEAFVSAPYGVGVQAMAYAYRGKLVQFHVLDVGVLVNFKECGGPGSPCRFNLSNEEFPRRVDLLFGMGVQVKLHCNVDFTADWRVDVPNMVGLHDHRDLAVADPYLDMGHVFRNSFGSSQLIVGFNFHD
jgi:hypothetical protein